MARRTKGIRPKRTRRTRRASTQKRRRTQRPTRRTQKRQRGGAKDDERIQSSGQMTIVPAGSTTPSLSAVSNPSFLEHVLPQEVGMFILAELDDNAIRALRLVSERIKEGVYETYLNFIYQRIEARVRRWENCLQTVNYASPSFLNKGEECVFANNIRILRQHQHQHQHNTVSTGLQLAAVQSQIEGVGNLMGHPNMEGPLEDHYNRGLSRQSNFNDQQTGAQWDFARRATLALCTLSLHENEKVRARMNELYQSISNIGEEKELAMVIELMITDYVVKAVRKGHVNEYWNTFDDLSPKPKPEIYTCILLSPVNTRAREFMDRRQGSIPVLTIEPQAHLETLTDSPLEGPSVPPLEGQEGQEGQEVHVVHPPPIDRDRVQVHRVVMQPTDPSFLTQLIGNAVDEYYRGFPEFDQFLDQFPPPALNTGPDTDTEPAPALNLNTEPAPEPTPELVPEPTPAIINLNPDTYPEPEPDPDPDLGSPQG